MIIGCVGLVLVEHKILAVECSKGRGIILPGGKYDSGKDSSFHYAASREVEEETGIYCPVDKMKYLMGAPSGDGSYCMCFIAYEAYGKFIESEEGKPVLATRQELFQSKFAAYYHIMFEILDKLSDLDIKIEIDNAKIN